MTADRGRGPVPAGLVLAGLVLAGLVLAVLVLGLAPAAGAEPVPEPPAYRGEPYRAPVPATLAGATVIDDASAQTLHAAGAPFLDVYPRPARPAGLTPGTVWRDPPHETIPGASWLPNTGWQGLKPDEAGLLRTGADTLAPDRRAPVVVFCRADCWMSWNAAKRLVEWGWTAVHWYPDGTDGWQAAGGSLVRVQPWTPPS